MCTGECYKRTARLSAYLDNIYLYSVALVVDLTGYLLLGEQGNAARAGVDNYRPVCRHGLVHGRGDNLFFLIFVLFYEHSALSLAYALNDHLLCSLCTDSAELLQRHLYFTDVSYLGAAGDTLGVDERYLLVGIGDLVNDLLELNHSEYLFIGIENDTYLAVAFLFMLICLCQSLLDTVDDNIGGDALLLAELINCLEKICVHLFSFHFLL